MDELKRLIEEAKESTSVSTLKRTVVAALDLIEGRLTALENNQQSEPKAGKKV
jgi:hypothetical protein